MPVLQAPSVNYWPKSSCARAFWGQQDLPPYQRLLADTVAWLEPQAGQSWLDLGCGCGKLTEALWVKSGGKIKEIIGLDCAADNELAFQRLRAKVQPRPSENQVRFLCSDFSSGLSKWQHGSIDGVTSGLAIQYAEAFSEEKGGWTTDAYDHLLAEVYRVLRQGGSFVFSVNIPNPPWGKLAWSSVQGVFKTSQPARYLKRAWRMYRYGAWLNREARRGRFHYLPQETITAKLNQTGFENIDSRVSYDGLAYLFRCSK